jgi:sugar/nucleoside kinase (ribokinase family)
MSKRVISIGDLVLDIILPSKLPVVHHQDVPTRRVEPGGAGNFMIAARRMGLEVTAVGAVGADVFGQQILQILHAEGVESTGVVAVPDSTSTVVVVLTDQNSGEHVFIGHYGEGPEVPYLPSIDQQIARADIVFVQGYTLSEKRVAPMAQRAVEHAVAIGKPIYLDVGPFMAQVTPERNRWIVEHADVILMTEDEVPLVSGGLAGDSAYDSLLARRAQTLVVKQGAAGCTVMTRDLCEHVPGFNVPVVDTVGAGDCFDAAFVAGRLAGLDLRECGLLANAMGAASVQKMGAGTNAPTCEEVLTLLNQSGVELNFLC